MIPFTLIIEETADDKAATGRELRKRYEWPLVPRGGEIVGVGGNCYPVHEVIHNMDRVPATIEVIVRWSTPDFETLSEDLTWEKAYWHD